MKKLLLFLLSLLFVLSITACDSVMDTETDKEEILVGNILSLSFFSSDDINLKVGENKSNSYVLVTVRKRADFSPDDVEFISEDSNVATIEFKNDALTVYLYYKVTAVGGGETYVYAKAKDGDAVSDKIKVIVEGEPYSASAETIPETTEPPVIEETEAPPPPSPETAAEVESVLKLVSVTTPCENGSNATVTIIGKPNTEYKISVYYSTKASDAQGLEPKISDNNGNVSWTWKVGANTTAGEHEIKISGGGETIKTTFTTYKG